jgi:hypothetical protein
VAPACDVHASSVQSVAVRSSPVDLLPRQHMPLSGASPSSATQWPWCPQLAVQMLLQVGSLFCRQLKRADFVEVCNSMSRGHDGGPALVVWPQLGNAMWAVQHCLRAPGVFGFVNAHRLQPSQQPAASAL